MPMSPYDHLPPRAFWKSGVAEALPDSLFDIYDRKFAISPDDVIATAGSCFAQHIGRQLKNRGFHVLDAEPPPVGLPKVDHLRFGYSTYSARYGNIYTTRQLLQLCQECMSVWTPTEEAWLGPQGWNDAQRPNIEPAGFSTLAELRALRRYHLACVKRMFIEMDIFIFTLGLTEAWVDSAETTVFPTAPGVIAGTYAADRYRLKNFSFSEVVHDFEEFVSLVSRLRGDRPPVRYLLTVSPVPLTGTASGNHVLAATARSKAVLRAAADQIAESNPYTDYFPSYEIITNPAARGAWFHDNLRTVTPEGVDAVMKVFFHHHGSQSPQETEQQSPPPSKAALFEGPPVIDVVCEEMLVERFLR